MQVIEYSYRRQVYDPLSWFGCMMGISERLIRGKEG